jgi:DNA-binding response OmpR family regulator
LQSKRVLLVDDEALIAMDAEDVLIDAGYCVVGPAHRLEFALKLAREAPLDAAVLDVNLAGLAVWPVADSLFARGIPFVLLTGFGRGLEIPDSCLGAPMIGKPLCAAELLGALDSLFPKAFSSEVDAGSHKENAF